MPRVPSAEAQVRQAAVPGARMGAQYSPDTFGASIGEAAQHASRVYTEVYRQEKQRVDQIAENEFTNKLSETQRKYEQAGLALQGKDAFGAADRLRADYDKESGEIEKTLANQEQRDAFRAQKEARGQQLYGRLVGHTMQQTRQFDEQETRSLVANWKTEAAADPSQAADKIAKMRETIAAFSRRNGMPQAYTDQQAGEAISGTHHQIIENMLKDGNDLGAKAYFDKNSSELLPDDRADAARSLEIGSLRGESQRITDQVILKISKGELVSEEDAVQEAIKLAGDNPKLRDQATQDAANAFNRHQRSVEDKQKHYVDMADEMFGQNNSIQDVDPGVWSKLTEAHKQAYRKLESQIARGENVPDGSDAYYKLRVALLNPETRQDAVRVDLRTVRPDMSPKNYGELIDLQASTMKDIAGDRKREGEDRQTASFNIREKVAAKTLKDLKMAPEEGYSVKGEWVSNPNAIAFRKQLDDQVDAEEASRRKKGDDKPLSMEETRKIALRLAADISIDKPGTLWGVNTTHSPAFLLPNADKQAYRIEGVPQDYIDKARKAAAGKALTDDDLINGYNRWLNLPEPETPARYASFPFMGG